MTRSKRTTTKATAAKAKRASGRRPESAEETQARTATRWTTGNRQVPALSVWDAEDVLAALRSHITGTFRTAALLADWVAQSDAVSAPLQALQRSILGLPFSVEAADESAIASALAARYGVEWGDTFPRGVASEVIRWCALMGFCIVERRWHLDPIEGRWTVRPRVVHPAWTRWSWSADRFIVSTATGEEIVEPGLGTRYAVFVDLDASRPWMSGAILPLGILALIAWWSDRDGARWGERHGLPPIGAKVPMDQWDSPKTDAFINALSELGTEPIVRLPTDVKSGHGFDLEWKELKNQEAWKGFLEGGRDVRTRAATMLLGQPLTTQAGVGGSGSYALGQVHAQVRADVMESYALLLGTAREHLLAPLVWLNDEPDPRVAKKITPRPRFDATPPTDQLAEASASLVRADAVAAWRNAGADVDVNAEAAAAGMILRGAPSSVRGARRVRSLPDRYAEIDFQPTQGMADAAARGLELHEEGLSGDGLKPETVRRANQIAARELLTPDHVREMRGWFARHETDRTPDWADPPTPGYVAWQLWGGDAGQGWSSKVVEQMDAADEADEAEKGGAKHSHRHQRAAKLQPERRAAEGQAFVDELHTAACKAAPEALAAGIVGDIRKAVRESLSTVDLRKRLEALRGAKSPAFRELVRGTVLSAGAAGALSVRPSDG
jgi:hypothetical protein